MAILSHKVVYSPPLSSSNLNQLPTDDVFHRSKCVISNHSNTRVNLNQSLLRYKTSSNPFFFPHLLSSVNSCQGKGKNKKSFYCSALKESNDSNPSSESNAKGNENNDSNPSSEKSVRDKEKKDSNPKEENYERLEINWELFSGMLSINKTEDKIPVEIFAAFMNEVCTDSFLSFYEMDGKRVNEWTGNKTISFFSNFFDYDSLSNFVEFEPRLVDWNLERELRERVFDSSLFDVAYCEEYPEAPGSRLFVGEMKAPSDVVYNELKKRLDERFPELALFLLDDNDGYSWILVSYRDSLIRYIPDIPLLQIASFVSVLFFLNQLLYKDPTLVSGVSAAFTSVLFQFGFLAIFFSSIVGESLCALAYGLPIPNHIIGFLSPGLGAIGTCIRHKKFKPTRICAIDTALANSLSSAAASIALILAPPINFTAEFPSLRAFGFLEASGSLSGVVLVPVDFLNHSAVLSDLSVLLSNAIIPEQGIEIMAIRPLALAGLLGLNFTAFNLLPVPSLNGGKIFYNIFNGSLLAVFFGLLAIPVLALLGFKWIWFFFIINVILSASFIEDSLPLNSRPSPDVIRTVIGLVLVTGGVCTLLPSKVFGSVSAEFIRSLL